MAPEQTPGFRVRTLAWDKANICACVNLVLEQMFVQSQGKAVFMASVDMETG